MTVEGRNQVLVLGGSSYIGRHLVGRMSPDRCIATYFRAPIDGGVYFDALSMSLSQVIDRPQDISHAVILLGDTKPDSCAANVPCSQALNVSSIKSILGYLRQWRIKPVFTSSESVFDGRKGDYIECDEPRPILTYGRQKIEMEGHIRDNFDHYIIARLALNYGTQRGDGTLFTSWLDAIEAGRAIYCAYDQVCSPIHVEDTVEALVRLMEGNFDGIFHVAGTKAFSKVELNAVLLNQLKEYSTVQAEVVACSIHDFKVRERHPMNISMRPDKLVRATGVQIRDVETSCKTIVEGAYCNR